MHSLYRAPVLGGNAGRIIHDIDSSTQLFAGPHAHRIHPQKVQEGEGHLMIANVDGSGEKLLSKQDTRT